MRIDHTGRIECHCGHSRLPSDPCLNDRCADYGPKPARRAAVIAALGATEYQTGRWAWVLNEGATKKTYLSARTCDLDTIDLSGEYPVWPRNPETDLANNRAVMMPDWWSPTNRSTFRCGCGKSPSRPKVNFALHPHCLGKGFERITVDLSGAEVPA